MVPRWGPSGELSSHQLIFPGAGNSLAVHGQDLVLPSQGLGFNPQPGTKTPSCVAWPKKKKKRETTKQDRQTKPKTNHKNKTKKPEENKKQENNQPNKNPKTQIKNTKGQ